MVAEPITQHQWVDYASSAHDRLIQEIAVMTDKEVGSREDCAVGVGAIFLVAARWRIPQRFDEHRELNEARDEGVEVESCNSLATEKSRHLSAHPDLSVLHHDACRHCHAKRRWDQAKDRRLNACCVSERPNEHVRVDYDQRQLIRQARCPLASVARPRAARRSVPA